MLETDQRGTVCPPAVAVKLYNSIQGDTVYDSEDGQTSPVATAAPEVFTGQPSGSAACLLDCGGDAEGPRLAVDVSLVKADKHEQGLVGCSQPINLHPHRLPCLAVLCHDDLDCSNLRSTVFYESGEEYNNFTYLLNPGPNGVNSQESHKYSNFQLSISTTFII